MPTEHVTSSPDTGAQVAPGVEVVAVAALTRAGRVSVMVTLVASDGPLLWAVSRQVTVWPATTGFGTTVLVSDRSACEAVGST